MEDHGRDTGFLSGMHVDQGRINKSLGSAGNECGAMASSKFASGTPCNVAADAPYLHAQQERARELQEKIKAAERTMTKTTEVRTVDPNTGGEKGAKLQRFSLIPTDFIWALASHYGLGARKYADRNWEKGYKWSLTLDAMMRHLSQWLEGEDDDPETGSSHLIAVAWHVVALWWFHRHGKGTNDVRTFDRQPAQRKPTVYGESPIQTVQRAIAEMEKVNAQINKVREAARPTYIDRATEDRFVDERREPLTGDRAYEDRRADSNRSR